MKTGVKVLIGLRVLIKGKHRTSIEHNVWDGIDGVTFLEILGEGMIE